MEPNIGDKFFQETRYTRDNLAAMRASDESLRPEPYKNYAGKQRVILTPPKPPEGLLSLAQSLQKRRTMRNFNNKPLTLEQLSYLLWATDGDSLNEGEFHLRTAPSAGALYPIETYVVINRVEGVSAGLYHYAVKEHYLENLKEGELGRDFSKAAMGQRTCAEASIVLIWTAVFLRTTHRYHARGYRYIYLDAGHIAQNMALTATALGLGTCQIGAYFDGEIDQLLNLESTEESVVYMSVVGHIG